MVEIWVFRGSQNLKPNFSMTIKNNTSSIQANDMSSTNLKKKTNATNDNCVVYPIKKFKKETKCTGLCFETQVYMAFMWVNYPFIIIKKTLKKKTCQGHERSCVASTMRLPSYRG